MKTLKKIEVEVSPELSRLSNELQELNNSIVSEYLQRLDRELEIHVRKNAKPPIKGEITKGKLTWRGLRYCSCPSTGETWIEQRGEQITPKFKMPLPRL